MDKPFFSVKAHDSIINAIDGNKATLSVDVVWATQGVSRCKGPGPVEVVTGSRDGSVKIWDPRTQDPVVCLEPVPDARAASAGVSVADCWAVAFGNAYNEIERVVAAGYDNGDIKLFDLRTMQLRWDTNVKNGVTHVAFDRKDIKMNKLAVSCLEATMIVYDMRTYNPTTGYSGCLEKVLTRGENQKNQPQGGAGTVWGCHFLPQNRDIWCTAGGSGGLFLHKYNYPMERETRDKNNNPVGVAGTCELLNQRDVSTQPIIAFDWHPDKEGLAVMGSLDQTVKVAIYKSQALNDSDVLFLESRVRTLENDVKALSAQLMDSQTELAVIREARDKYRDLYTRFAERHEELMVRLNTAEREREAAARDRERLQVFLKTCCEENNEDAYSLGVKLARSRETLRAMQGSLGYARSEITRLEQSNQELTEEIRRADRATREASILKAHFYSGESGVPDYDPSLRQALQEMEAIDAEIDKLDPAYATWKNRIKCLRAPNGYVTAEDASAGSTEVVVEYTASSCRETEEAPLQFAEENLCEILCSEIAFLERKLQRSEEYNKWGGSSPEMTVGDLSPMSFVSSRGAATPPSFGGWSLEEVSRRCDALEDEMQQIRARLVSTGGSVEAGGTVDKAVETSTCSDGGIATRIEPLEEEVRCARDEARRWKDAYRRLEQDQRKLIEASHEDEKHLQELSAQVQRSGFPS
ncbi:WD repeat-containing protein 92 [Perkinsus olseni]|uniref:WD repeat-containing protein 92 n=1 Tax=Perkinsus olseni TaxID=32597 RepID=A0A7J6PGA8_PEROL|nr:WD repeat-containing protein 92 [Perkinsus olseni]